MRTVAFIFFTFFLSCEGAQDDHEHFDELHIPGAKYFVASQEERNVGHCFSSKRGSPINIDLATVTTVNLPTMKLEGYDKSEKVSESHASNFTATIHGYANWTFQPTMSGGSLEGNYKLIEIYWDILPTSFISFSRLYEYGHAINNRHSSFEVHLVHTKDGLPLEEAKNVPGGVLIVASMFESMMRNGRFQQETVSISHPENAGEEFTWVSPKFFLPNDNQTYFVYNGTLAYPPCLGDVTWIVMANTISIDDQNVNSIFHTNRYAKINQHMSDYTVNNKTNSQVLLNRPKKIAFDKIDSLAVATESGKYMSIVLGILAAILCAGIVVFAGYKIVEKRRKFSISNDSNNGVAFNNQNHISFVTDM